MKYKNTENHGNLQGKAYQYPWTQRTKNRHEEITLVPSEVQAYMKRLQADVDSCRYELKKKDEEVKKLIDETDKMKEELEGQVNLQIDFGNLQPVEGR